MIQWDKDDLDSLGLLKVDVLALGMLTAIRKSFELIATYRGRQPDDGRDSEGGSGGLRDDRTGRHGGRLPDRVAGADGDAAEVAAPKEFYDLVIEVAIVRPGPIQGGMVHPYTCAAEAGPGAGALPVRGGTPRCSSALSGMPIFQEQVMQLAVVAAGFSPGEADRLRRAMAAWHRRGGLGPFERKLIDGMRARGYEEEFARAIFRQIEGFGEYGFPESHSASFALLAYVSAWLKRHEPAVFTCALLNSQPMGFYAPAQLVQDARRHGVEVRGVDVRYSEWDCRLEPGRDAEPALRLGFRMVKGLSEPSAARIVAARASREAHRCCGLLVRCGSRPAGRAVARATCDASPAPARSPPSPVTATGRTGTRRGWRSPRRCFPIRVSRRRLRCCAPRAKAKTWSPTIATSASASGRHPLALLRRRLDSFGLCRAADLRAAPNGQPAQAAGLVVSRQRPLHRERDHFPDSGGRDRPHQRRGPPEGLGAPSPRSAGSPPARGARRRSNARARWCT